jgi:hypothetical protein
VILAVYTGGPGVDGGLENLPVEDAYAHVDEYVHAQYVVGTFPYHDEAEIQSNPFTAVIDLDDGKVLVRDPRKDEPYQPVTLQIILDAVALASTN